jgi:hypothetical protein
MLRWFGFPAFIADQAATRPLSNHTITYQNRIYCQYKLGANTAFVAERIGSDKLIHLCTFSHRNDKTKKNTYFERGVIKD